jgi:hypothetical protein
MRKDTQTPRQTEPKSKKIEFLIVFRFCYSFFVELLYNLFVNVRMAPVSHAKHKIAQEAKVMATYSLTVENRSLRSGNICVYATSPDSKKIHRDLLSLAWFSKAAHPKTDVRFEWDLDFSFVWSQTGELFPGIRFVASEIESAEPGNIKKEKICFDNEDDAYRFKASRRANESPTGNLCIATSATVPNNDAAIGIGISGKPALVVAATPNYTFTFIPHLRYWLAFGTFTEGEVLDLNAMTSEIHEITFPSNVYNKIVRLNERNLWEEVDGF